MKTNNKLREALMMVRDAHYIKELDGELYEGFEVEADDGTGRPLICVVEDALAAPLRNCDRFETAEDAKKEFNYLWNFVWKRGGGFVDEREYRIEYEKWLFAPIQEGETDGSK